MNYAYMLWESIFDCYWTLYKTQIPNPRHCLDDGPEFVANLSFLGWILYKIRPFMIRPKRRRSSSPIPYRIRIRDKTREQLLPYDPTHSRLYYSLVANSLQSIFTGFVCHIGDTCSETKTIIDGNSIITYHVSDIDAIYDWLHSDNISYICTRDYCTFPQFDEIPFDDVIQRSLYIQNAGGSSELSEALSMYYMELRFNAYNFIPEMDVQYYLESKICDYIMNVGDNKIGVSVTRAVAYPPDSAISPMFASSLLHKKLIGIIVAKQTVVECQSFNASVIHVWCKSVGDADVVRHEYASIVAGDMYNLYGHVYIVCSVCPSKFIYTNIKSD